MKNANQELETLLRELNEETGLSLSCTEDDPAKAAEMVKRLLLSYRLANSSNYLLNRILTGTPTLTELREAARKLRVDAEQPYQIFLICPSRDSDYDIAGLMSNLFGRKPGNFSVSLDNGSTALLFRIPRHNAPDAQETANMILDAVTSEAMLDSIVSYSSILPRFTEISRGYREAYSAMEIGRIFTSSDRIFAYEELGAMRLIYDLPLETCRDYIRETLPGGLPEKFDEEVLLAARIFFKHGLNISEAAKELYIHRNTLIYRLEKLHAATGLDLRNFEDAVRFKNVMLIMERLRYEEKNS